MHWQTKEDRYTLLKKLVAIPSISRSEAEKDVPLFLQSECMNLPYFQQHPERTSSHHFNDGSSFFSAFVHGKTNQTILLISHYDVVGVEDYGHQRDIAFDVEQMTTFYEKNPHLLPTPLPQGDWVFGRGTMDMKAGLVVEMGLLEKAAAGAFDGSVLLIAVGDEEVGSNGMLHATKEIERLKKEHNLAYELCLNTEPSFKEHPHDDNKYLYTGTIGKVLPSFFFKGQETHVGEPFAGLNASFMCSVLTNELELSTDFQEEIDGEKTQALTNLMMRDLKPFYNVQTPVSAISLFNLLYMEASIDEITTKLLKKTKEIATHIVSLYEERAKKAGVTPLSFNIRVQSFEELYQEVEQSFGKEEIARRIDFCLANEPTLDEREKSLKIVQLLCDLSEESTPTIIFFYSPPFYPAVSSRNHTLIQELSSFVQTYATQQHNTVIEKRAFFQGLCDLSYVASPKGDIQPLVHNMPLFEKGYHIPFDTIQSFDFPVLNIGTYGCDPHQKTERLELNYSFNILPAILEAMFVHVFTQ